MFDYLFQMGKKLEDRGVWGFLLVMIFITTVSMSVILGIALGVEQLLNHYLPN